MMAMNVVSVGFRFDPDFEESVAEIGHMIRDAYNRGAISWQRRCDLLENHSEAIRVNTYMVPTTKGDPMIVGIYVDAQPDMLTELGLS